MEDVGQGVGSAKGYRPLQRQLDRSVTGLPDSPIVEQILRQLFSPADAALAARLPNLPVSLEELARRLAVPPQELQSRLDMMADRGLVLDLEHQGRRYFSLAPMALGFFEFTFMRLRDDLPVRELARLFEDYMQEGLPETDRPGGGIFGSVFAGKTQIGRTLVHEEALAGGASSQVLDWDRASHVIQSASALGLSLCACRHKASLLGRSCHRPQQVCLSLNYAADSLVRHGLAERTTVAGAMRVLEESKAAGLAQLADNVQRRVSYLCNCCGCCCAMIRAIRTYRIRGAVTTSNWVASVDPARCSGCGACLATCPVGAIELVQVEADRPGRALVDPQSCLGCGACAAPCRCGAMAMHSRPSRVFTPETIFDRIALMAIERGKLAGLLFEHPQGLGQRAMARVLALLEKTSLLTAMAAVAPLRSVFLDRVLARVKKRLGAAVTILE